MFKATCQIIRRLFAPERLVMLLMVQGGLAMHLAAAPASSSLEAARDLIRRIVPEQADQFVLEIIPADGGNDNFEVAGGSGKIVLRGDNGVAMASALNWYLKNYCHCDLSWNCGDQMSLPKRLPPVTATVHVTSPHQFRYAYNFCTYGYTMAWWGWPKWEHELDFLAMNGVNLALVIEGQEATWINTFTNFGYSPEKMRAWVVDPAHLPWMEMDNLESYGGPLSPSLVAARLSLGQKIISRMRALGMEPVLPGYYGMVPPDFSRQFPGAKVHVQGDWEHLKRPDILDPTDPLFPKVAASFYKAQNDLFDGAKFYDADPFHEGGATSNIDIPAAGRAIEQAMNGATWVLQSWWKNPRQDMVDALDKNKTLVLDLYCEDHENWRLRNNFNGAPWLWCTINCFGGNMNVGGRLAWMAQGPDAALVDTAKGRMSGIGALMEATGVKPVLQEMLLENTWRSKAPDLKPWLDDYLDRRYGAKVPAAEAAGGILAETVYDESAALAAHVLRPAVCLRPYLEPTAATATRPPSAKNQLFSQSQDASARLVQAWRLLIASAPEAAHSDGYRFDLCDLGRQVLANLSSQYNHQIDEAFRAGDRGKLEVLSGKMLGLILDLDRLAGTRREWLLGRWLADARSWGATPAEKDLCERNARELLTTWTRYDNIPDYASRQWNGLLGDFYHHRWELWLQAMKDSAATGKAFNATVTRAKIQDWELAWTTQTNGHFLTQPQGDPIVISRNLFQKYAADASQPVTGN